MTTTPDQPGRAMTMREIREGLGHVQPGQPETAVDRIPLTRSVHYAVRGLPEVPNQYGPGILAPSEITITYRDATDSQLGRIHAYVAGRIWVDGKELPLLPGGLYGQHYFDGLDGWPEWLAEEARLHEPAVSSAGQAPATDHADLRTALDGLHTLIATSSRDWGAYRVDAWIWAVLCGWDCEATKHDDTCTHGALEEMAVQHGWDADTVAKARRYRAAVRAVTDGASLPAPTDQLDNSELRRMADETPDTQTQPETCRSIVVDGQTISVRGSGVPAELDLAFFGEVVRAAKRRYAAEHPAEPAAGARQDDVWPVKDAARRYAEHLRATPGQASADGHTGWECDAGAQLLVGADTPGPGKLGTHHGVIYACAVHRAAASVRIMGAGYEVAPRPAPPGHRWDPWPCGHVTAYSREALSALAEVHQPAARARQVEPDLDPDGRHAAARYFLGKDIPTEQDGVQP